MNTSPLLVVFDIDGTLTVSVKIHQQAFLQALELFGLTEIDTDWGSYQHFSDSWIFQANFQRRHGRFANEQEFARFQQLFDAAYLEALGDDTVEPLPGASAALAELTARNIPFCFATGSLRSAAEHKLACFQGITTLPVLATASEAQTREDIVSLAVEQAKTHHGVDGFTRIVSIGDGIWDYRTARNLQVEFLGIGEAEAAGRLQAEGAKLVIPNFLDSAWLTLLI